MKIEKSALSLQDLATRYYELAHSVLEAMIDATLKGNLPAVFVLNRPLIEACFRGSQICLVQPGKIDDADSLEEVAATIDEVIQQRFEEWQLPFHDKRVVNRYAEFLKSLS